MAKTTPFDTIWSIHFAIWGPTTRASQSAELRSTGMRRNSLQKVSFALRSRAIPGFLADNRVKFAVPSDTANLETPISPVRVLR